MEPYQFTGGENVSSNNPTNSSDTRGGNTDGRSTKNNTFYNLSPEHYSNTGSIPRSQTAASSTAIPTPNQEQWQNPPSLTNYPSFYPPPPSFYQGPPQIQNLPPAPHHSHHSSSQYDSLYYPTPPPLGPNFPGMPPHLFDFVKNCESNDDEFDEHRPVVTLENKCLWQEFNEAGTEMIITKTGRYAPFFFFFFKNRDLLHFFTIT